MKMNIERGKYESPLLVAADISYDDTILLGSVPGNEGVILDEDEVDY